MGPIMEGSFTGTFVDRGGGAPTARSRARGPRRRRLRARPRQGGRAAPPLAMRPRSGRAKARAPFHVAMRRSVAGESEGIRSRRSRASSITSRDALDASESVPRAGSIPRCERRLHRRHAPFDVQVRARAEHHRRAALGDARELVRPRVDEMHEKDVRAERAERLRDVEDRTAGPRLRPARDLGEAFEPLRHKPGAALDGLALRRVFEEVERRFPTERARLGDEMAHHVRVRRVERVRRRGPRELAPGRDARRLSGKRDRTRHSRLVESAEHLVKDATGEPGFPPSGVRRRARSSRRRQPRYRSRRVRPPHARCRRVPPPRRALFARARAPPPRGAKPRPPGTRPRSAESSTCVWAFTRPGSSAPRTRSTGRPAWRAASSAAGPHVEDGSTGVHDHGAIAHRRGVTGEEVCGADDARHRPSPLRSPPRETQRVFRGASRESASASST
jgi:hypothetical protein